MGSGLFNPTGPGADYIERRASPPRSPCKFATLNPTKDSVAIADLLSPGERARRRLMIDARGVFNRVLSHLDTNHFLAQEDGFRTQGADLHPLFIAWPLRMPIFPSIDRRLLAGLRSA